MNDPEQEFITEEEIAVEEVEVAAPPKKSSKSSKKTRVTWFHETQGICYCVTDDGEGYQIPSEMCPTERGLTFDIDLSDESVKPLYNWDVEIAAALPERAVLEQNIRMALWRNGAISKEAAKANKVQQNLMRGAFPYRIEVIEE